MALSNGRSTEVTSSFKLYSGIDKFKVLGVNPNLETLKSWGVNMKNEPNYTRVEDDGTKRADIVVWVKSVTFPDLIGHVDFTLRNKKNEATTDGVHKTEMIDCFGNTAWLTDDEVRNKIVPLLKSGKPSKFYPQDMRPTRRGERALTEFFKFFVNVEDSHDYKKEEGWVFRPQATNSANYRFEEINKYFGGDVSELRGEIEKWPENTVKLLCGVYSSSKDGRMRQTIYPDLCFRAAANDVASAFSKEISRRKAKGGLKDHDYIFDKIQAWGVTADKEDNSEE